MRTNSNKYSAQCEIDDLVQVGNMGVVTAMKKYDISHKGKANFNTFAHWYIVGEMSNYMKQYGSTIRIPGPK